MQFPSANREFEDLWKNKLRRGLSLAIFLTENIISVNS